MANLIARRSSVAAAPVRTFVVRLLALYIAYWGAIPASASTPVEANAPSNEIRSQASFQRHYKATAYITLLSIPIFSRSGVGLVSPAPMSIPVARSNR